MRKVFPLIILTLTFAALAISGCAGRQPASENKNAVNVVQTNPSDMAKKLAAGEIDAFIAWEPFNAQAVLNGQGKYLVQSSEIWPDHPCCVLASAYSLSDPAVLQALVWSHIKATEFINNSAQL